jgi:hypothetical protein
MYVLDERLYMYSVLPEYRTLSGPSKKLVERGRGILAIRSIEFIGSAEGT